MFMIMTYITAAAYIKNSRTLYVLLDV